MCIGQPSVDRPHGHFDRKAGKKSQEQQRLHTAHNMNAQHIHIGKIKLMDHQSRNVCCSGLRKHCDHRDQHQNRAQEGIEEKLERRIDAVRTAPDTNNKKHWDKASFEEQIKQHQI